MFFIYNAKIIAKVELKRYLLSAGIFSIIIYKLSHC